MSPAEPVQAERVERTRVSPAFAAQRGSAQVNQACRARETPGRGAAQLQQWNQPGRHVFEEITMFDGRGRLDADVGRIAANRLLDGVGVMAVRPRDPVAQRTSGHAVARRCEGVGVGGGQGIGYEGVTPSQ